MGSIRENFASHSLAVLSLDNQIYIFKLGRGFLSKIYIWKILYFYSIHHMKLVMISAKWIRPNEANSRRHELHIKTGQFKSNTCQDMDPILTFILREVILAFLSICFSLSVFLSFFLIGLLLSVANLFLSGRSLLYLAHN